MNWSLVTTWKFFIQAHPLTSRVNNEVLKGGVTMKVVPLVQHYFHMMLLPFYSLQLRLAFFCLNFHFGLLWEKKGNFSP